VTDHQPHRRRREPPDVRRDQILDAAEAVLVDRGLASATIADVAERAGVAKGTVYLYFDSRAELLAALRARHIDHFKAALEQALEGPARFDPAKRLDRFVDRFFQYALAHRDLHHTLFHEAGFSEADGFAAVRAPLAAFVAAGMESGAFRAGDSAAVADFALAGIHSALVSALHAGPTGSRRHLVAAKEMSRRLLVAGGAEG
jgi:TetR/AcrR family transcriptional repressor of nem operon